MNNIQAIIAHPVYLLINNCSSSNCAKCTNAVRYGSVGFGVVWFLVWYCAVCCAAQMYTHFQLYILQ